MGIRRSLKPAAFLAVAITACGQPTAPTSGDLAAHRTIWLEKAPSHYSYQYEITGFFNALDGKPMTLEVRQDTVRSATFTQTGQPVPGSPAGLPTVDDLFIFASNMLENHWLGSIVFDPRFGYPVQMDIDGPPDASGTVLATAFQQLP